MQGGMARETSGENPLSAMHTHLLHDGCVPCQAFFKVVDTGGKGCLCFKDFNAMLECFKNPAVFQPPLKGMDEEVKRDASV